MTRYVIEKLRTHGVSAVAFSTNDFFMRGGRYVYDLKKLHSNHALNLKKFTAALERGADVVVCDNINLLPWQSQPYTDAARMHNYRILFLNFVPPELEKLLEAQKATPENPNAHGVSKADLDRFLDNFNNYNDLLDRNTIRDIKRHHVFVWNSIDNVVMDTGELAQYFDSDKVITIRPDEFDTLKETLADSILQFMCEADGDEKQCVSKNRILLTWYGITDISAALGILPVGGPVLGALRAGNYTDVIILGYTNPNKPQNGFSGSMRKEWEKYKALPINERLQYPREKVQNFVNAICNTEIGHRLFIDYLKEANLPVNIHFAPNELSHLNDAKSIDEAARAALNIALRGDEEKSITCFLSPGTPVMAHTWCMLSLTNPHLHLRLISSSEPGKPPETIDLPKYVVPPSIPLNPTAPPTDFDVVLHLLGTGTNIPQYFCMDQFPAKKHWFITSDDSKKTDALRRLLPKDVRMHITRVDAFEPAHTRKAIEDIVRRLPPTTRIGINLTGGTKLMFAGALNACYEFPNLEPFYFSTQQNCITFLRTDAKVQFKGVTKVDPFFIASGYKISQDGKWEDNPVRQTRRKLTLKLWEYRTELRELYKAMSDDNYKTYRLSNKPDKMFEYETDHITAAFDGKLIGTLVINGKKLKVPNCKDFGTYIKGGWLEEYAYLRLLPLMESGSIFDLRIGLEVVPANKSVKTRPVGEFDCVYTDGRRLYIVECKAGTITQEHIQKLENNLKTYGGITAKGELVLTFPAGELDKEHKERIDSSTSIHLVNWADEKCKTDPDKAH
ncbi:MAG: DUF1887 family protein [Thermoguttaceae bacterium]|nr:DUF1887 family protein [Thermoguttaceae bacterium]